MAARIQSLRNGLNPVDEASRNDLVIGDLVTVSSLDAATTYNWTIVFAPQGSAATFSGDPSAVSPGSFTVDVDGPYLIRLVTDAALVSEDTQYVRLRALTSTLGLTLVAAGERRDATGIIPVDVDVVGWAYEQNANLLALEAAATTVDTLAATLVAGNATGGTNILVSTGDEILGQTDVVLRSTGAGSNIELNPDATGAVIVNGKLTVTGIIDPTAVVFTQAAAPTTGASEGAVFVSDGSGGLTADHLYYRPASDGVPVDLLAGGGSAPSWFGTTINAVPTQLFTDGIGAQYILTNLSVIKFTWEIVAGSAAGAAGFKVSGVIKRGVGAGTTALVGAPILETTGTDPALATATVTAVADNVNGALVPVVQGVAATTIKWVVTMASYSLVTV